MGWWVVGVWVWVGIETGVRVVGGVVFDVDVAGMRERGGLVAEVVVEVRS